MMNNEDDKIKFSAFPRSKRRIRNSNWNFQMDLADRIDSLQRAVANERGESQRFREAVCAKLGLRLPEEDEEP